MYMIPSIFSIPHKLDIFGCVYMAVNLLNTKDHEQAAMKAQVLCQ